MGAKNKNTDPCGRDSQNNGNLSPEQRQAPSLHPQNNNPNPEPNIIENHVYQLDLENNNNNINLLNNNHVYINPIEFLVSHTFIDETLSHHNMHSNNNHNNHNNNNNHLIDSNYLLGHGKTPADTPVKEVIVLNPKKALKDKEKALRAVEKAQRERVKAEKKRLKEEKKREMKNKPKPISARMRSGGGGSGPGRKGGDDSMMSRPRRRVVNKKDKETQIK